MTTSFYTPTDASAIAASSVSSQPVATARKSGFHVRLEGLWLEIYQPLLSRAAFSVFVALRKRLGVNAYAFPSHKTIAKDTNCSVSTVKRALKELREIGLVSWARCTETTEYGKQRQTSNHYFLAQNDLPPQSKKSNSPRSKKATKQITGETVKQQTPLRAKNVVVALSQSEDVSTPQSPTSSLEMRLQEFGVTAFVARNLVANFPHERIEQQIAWLAARKPRSRAATLVKSIKENWAAPTPASKTFVSPPFKNRSDMTTTTHNRSEKVAETPTNPAPPEAELLPSEADIVAANEARDPEHYNRPHAQPETGEGFETLRALMNALKKGTFVPSSNGDAAPVKRDAGDPMQNAREALRNHSPRFVLSFRERLAPGLSCEEWSAVVEAAQAEMTH